MIRMIKYEYDMVNAGTVIYAPLKYHLLTSN